MSAPGSCAHTRQASIASALSLDAVALDDDAMARLPLTIGSAGPTYHPAAGELSIASCLSLFCAEEQLDGEDVCATGEQDVYEWRRDSLRRDK